MKETFVNLLGLHLVVIVVCLFEAQSFGQCTIFVETPMGEGPDGPLIDVGIGINNCPGGYSGGRIIFDDGFLETSQPFGPGADGGVETFTVRDTLLTGSYFIRVELQPVGAPLLTFGGDGIPFEDGSQDFLTIGDPALFQIFNLQVSPGIVDVSSSGNSADFSFEIENQGLTDPDVVCVTLRPPSAQLPPIELDSNGNGIDFVFDPNVFPTVVTFSQFFPVSADPGGWTIDIVVKNSFGDRAEFPDAGGFVVQGGSPGDSQNNPILPDMIDEDGNFIFTSIPGNTILLDGSPDGLWLCLSDHQCNAHCQSRWSAARD